MGVRLTQSRFTAMCIPLMPLGDGTIEILYFSPISLWLNFSACNIWLARQSEATRRLIKVTLQTKRKCMNVSCAFVSILLWGSNGPWPITIVQHI